jgi:hypothetical protein
MRRLATIIVLLLFGFSLSAQDRMLIETIEVEHPAGIPDRIILSEARLTAGETYSEEEVRQALHRIRRLPFVFLAAYRLEPGTNTSARRLVFTVKPGYRFNMSLDLLYQHEENFDYGNIAPSLAYRTFAGNSNFEASIGSSSFTDGGGDYRNFTLRYSGYDLFGTGTVVQLALARTLSRDARIELSPTARVILPLTQIQSIVGNFTTTREEFDREFGIVRIRVTTAIRRTDADLLWTRDTTDDPFFTLKGTSLLAGPRLMQFDIASPLVVGNPPTVTPSQRRQRRLGLAFAGSHFFPLGQKSTIRMTVDGFAGQDRTKSLTARFVSSMTLVETRVFATVARNFGPFFGPDDSPGTPGRHRLEAGLAYQLRASRDDQDSTENDYGFTAGYTYRHPRFFFRFVTNYYDR